jgi:hypothetical protein
MIKVAFYSLTLPLGLRVCTNHNADISLYCRIYQVTKPMLSAATPLAFDGHAGYVLARLFPESAAKPAGFQILDDYVDPGSVTVSLGRAVGLHLTPDITNALFPQPLDEFSRLLVRDFVVFR